MLLRPWIRHFLKSVLSKKAYLLVALTSNKFSEQDFEEIHRNIVLQETPKQARIPPNLKYSLQKIVSGSPNS